LGHDQHVGVSDVGGTGGGLDGFKDRSQHLLEARGQCLSDLDLVAVAGSKRQVAI
jgi:hypothetical protein